MAVFAASSNHIHANEIQEFGTAGNNVGVIYEADYHYGKVKNVPRITLLETKDHFHEDYDLKHLEPLKRKEFMTILKYANLRSSILKITNVGKHYQNQMESIPKKLSFRIPEVLKCKDDQQIDELLLLGPNVESESECVHPVKKKIEP